MSEKQPSRRVRGLGDRDSSSVSVGLVLCGAALVVVLGMLAWLTLITEDVPNPLDSMNDGAEAALYAIRNPS